MTENLNNGYQPPVSNNYGGPGYTENPVQNQQHPAQKKSGNLGLKIGGGVLALAILAGGGVAIANTMNTMGDKDIARALPATTAFYGEVDLDPSNDQKVAALSLINKVKYLAEDDKETKEETELGETLTNPYFEELDYETEVKPWLGGKVALGAWGSDSKLNDENVKTAVVYEINDEKKAQEALDKVQSDKVNGVIVDGYLVISEKAETVSSYEADLEAGNLADAETFKNDRKLIKENTVSEAWFDIGKLDTKEALSEYAEMASIDSSDELTGRIVSGLSLDAKGATLITKAVDVKGGGVETTISSSAKGVDDIKNIPASSVAAIGIKGLSESATTAWEANRDKIEDSPEFASATEQLAEYGIILPEDFTKIFGSETSLGFGASANGESFAVQYRAVGGDSGTLKTLTKNAGGSDVGLFVNDDNGVAEVTFGEAKDSAKLGDTEDFDSLLKNLDTATFAGVVDLDNMEEFQKSLKSAQGEDASDKEDKKLGKVGFTAGHDEESNVTDMTVRWLY